MRQGWVDLKDLGIISSSWMHIVKTNEGYWFENQSEFGGFYGPFPTEDAALDACADYEADQAQPEWEFD